MRWRAIAVLSVVAALAGPTSAATAGPFNGGRPCASLGVSSGAGSVGRSICSPAALPDQFQYPVEVYDCGGVPPVGISWCVSVTLYRP